MKVLVLGLPRSGTQSLADALAQLGISPVYHMREVGKNKHQGLWTEAMEAKFEGKGDPWARDDFDKILGGYEALADFPAAIFPEELISAYPEAAIILSTRPREAWFKSMMSTLIHQHNNRPANDTSPMFSMARKYHLHCWGNDFVLNGGEYFEKHTATVREVSLGRKFLEYEVGSGWEPLCEFLGVAVPKLDFPRSDDWAVNKWKKAVEDESWKAKEGR